MNKQYLPEDQDLLDELEKLSQKFGGESLAEIQHKTSAIQIESTLRSRKTSADLSNSTDKYSVVLISFAMAQIVVGFMQLTLSALPISSKIGGITYVVISAIIVITIIKKFMEIDRK